MSILSRFKDIIEPFIGANEDATIINDEIQERKLNVNLEEGKDFEVTVAGRSQGFVEKAKVNEEKAKKVAAGRKKSGKAVTPKTREE